MPTSANNNVQLPTELAWQNASLFLAAGAPMIYVKEQLGHSTIQVTVDLYGHGRPGENRDAVNGLPRSRVGQLSWKALRN